MKIARKFTCVILSLAILASLFSGCGNTEQTAEPEVSTVPFTEAATEPVEETAQLATQANGAPIPGDEFERGIWYGFLPDELATVDAASTPITWKQYCAMLGNMIGRYQPEALPEWEEMTANAPDTKMLRDGAAIALLYAAKTVNLHYCNRAGHEYYNPDFSWGHNFTWNYPIFDWESPIQLAGDLTENYDQSNAIAPAYWFLLGKVSCISNQPMLEIVDSDPNLLSILNCRDALISVVRLYESVEAVAMETAEKLLEQVLQTEAGKKIVAEAEARKAEILNSTTDIVKSDTFVQGETYTGTAYYVSNNGDDSADGMSPETAWATLERLKTVKFQFGDAVFFERGSLWRKAEMPESIVRTEGLTLSAYGTGEKPRFYGSPENGTGPEKWTLYYEGSNGEKIWKFYQEMTDCAAIVLNGEESIKRDVAYWDGSDYLSVDDFSVPYSMETQMQDMELFVELPYTQSPIKVNDKNNSESLGRYYGADRNGNYLTGPLYVRCDEGNPGELYVDIEFIAAYRSFDVMAEYMTVDNLCFRYSTSTICGGYSNGDSTDHLIIQNCEAGWNGGSLNWFAELQNATGFGHVHMDGGGFNVNGSFNVIQNCYTHHTFQEGLGLETFIGDKGPSEGIIIRDNVLEYCLLGITMINWEDDMDTDHVIQNSVVENNYSLYSGFETLYNHPPIIKDERSGEIHWVGRIGHVILDTVAFVQRRSGPDFRISGNTFAFSMSQLIEAKEKDVPCAPVYEGNTYAVLPGFAYTSRMINAWGPRETEHDAKSAVETFLGDKSAMIITFEE